MFNIGLGPVVREDLCTGQTNKHHFILSIDVYVFLNCCILHPVPMAENPFD